MIVQHSGARVVLQAPAKLNLHLEAWAKRPDGYHELETLMVSVGLCDTLEISAAPTGTVFVCNDPALAGAAEGRADPGRVGRGGTRGHRRPAVQPP